MAFAPRKIVTNPASPKHSSGGGARRPNHDYSSGYINRDLPLQRNTVVKTNSSRGLRSGSNDASKDSQKRSPIPISNKFVGASSSKGGKASPTFGKNSQSTRRKNKDMLIIETARQDGRPSISQAN